MLGTGAKAEREGPRTPRYQPLVIVLVAVCTGIVVDRAGGLPVGVWWAASGLGWGGWAFLRGRGRDRAAGVVLLISVAACAGAWHHLRWSRFRHSDLRSYAQTPAQPACVEALAVKRPRRLPAPPPNPMEVIPVVDRTQVEVEIAGIRDATSWRPASGRTRLTVDGHLLGVHRGDRLRAFGQLSVPRGAANPGDFDLATFHRADRRMSLLRSESPDCVSLIQPGHARTPARWIDHVRSRGEELLRRYIDEPHAGLAAAVLLGAREEIGSWRAQAFVETGTAHLLAISGLHVGIVAGALFLGLRLIQVPQNWAVVVVAVVTVLYAVLTDARPSAIRAAILILVMCAATYLGRRPVAFNSLAAAALVVLALNPADLFRTGVQLTFVPVAGLMWFAPRWLESARRPGGLARLRMESQGWLRRSIRVIGYWVWGLTLASLTIWLLTLPLVMARFHLLVLVAPVLTILLWVPIALALVCGFGVLAVGWLLPPLGAVFGWACNGSLGLLVSCIEIAQDVPCGHFWAPGPADWWLVGFYVGLGILAAFPAVRPPRRWCLAILAAWIAVGLAPWLLRSHKNRLDCTFLSVGHGCAVVVALPSGQAVLYDAGRLGLPEIGADVIASCVWSRGFTHLDAVVLSHCDADHYNAIPDLLGRISVRAVYVSPDMFEEENPAMQALRDALRKAKVPIREIAAGDGLNGGPGCSIEVLHPPRHRMRPSDNANSLVLGIEYLGHRILLTGDLQAPGLEDLLAEDPWPCDVLLAPHHGSRHSDPPGLVEWCSPRWVVISGGSGSLQPETVATYLSGGARVLHTATAGAVRATIDASGVHVWGFLGSP